MKFAIRVLNQFGENPQSVYDVLASQFTNVEVHEETQPYLHYHCMVEAGLVNVANVKKTMSNLQTRYRVNPLVRRRGNIDVQPVNDEPSYVNYMKKQNGRSYCEDDEKASREIHITQSTNSINPIDLDCEFKD